MSIKLFRDPDLEKLILTPANLQVGTPVYVQLSVDKQKLHADGPAKLIVEECYGSASDVNDKFTVIQNQIAIDDGTDILRSPSSMRCASEWSSSGYHRTVKSYTWPAPHTCAPPAMFLTGAAIGLLRRNTRRMQAESRPAMQKNLLPSQSSGLTVYYHTTRFFSQNWSANRITFPMNCLELESSRKRKSGKATA